MCLCAQAKTLWYYTQALACAVQVLPSVAGVGKAAAAVAEPGRKQQGATQSPQQPQVLHMICHALDACNALLQALTDSHANGHVELDVLCYLQTQVTTAALEEGINWPTSSNGAFWEQPARDKQLSIGTLLSTSTHECCRLPLLWSCNSVPGHMQ